MPSPIVLDTCALIFDALSPERLSKGATKAIEAAERHDLLFCSDMSLWEIAILMQKGRLSVDTDTTTFLNLAIEARKIRVLPITVDIAHRSVTLPPTIPYDPADRIILATALVQQATLITSDRRLLDTTLVRALS